MNTYGASRIMKDLEGRLSGELERVGLLCRVFSRVKSESSLDKKIESGGGKYSIDGKMIQDAIGLRIAVYFSDDCSIVEEITRKIFDFDEESSSIDHHDPRTFSATRRNLIFSIPENSVEEFSGIYKGFPVDNAFEIQLRTVLSEGWHEVEHDLRYKCQSDWDGHDDLNRALNGIYASIETSDWGMLTLFEKLSYRYYTKCLWPQMIRSKYRLRMQDFLSDPVRNYLSANPSLAKRLFRQSRAEFIKKLFSSGVELPITVENIIHMCNFWFIRDEDLFRLMPFSMCESLERTRE